MLIATFNNTTGWRGKTITFEDDHFILEGHGPVSPKNIMRYDEKGQLAWANDGARAWVGSKAGTSAAARARAIPAAPEAVQEKEDAPSILSRVFVDAYKQIKAKQYDEALATVRVAAPLALTICHYAEWLKTTTDSLRDRVSPDLKDECDDLFKQASEAVTRMHVVAEVKDCTVLGSARMLHVGDKCDLAFMDNLVKVRFSNGFEYPILYFLITALEIGGPGAQQTGGGFIGGGFGVEGAATGMLVGSALNLLTTRRRVKTVICLQEQDDELFLGYGGETPEQLRMRLSPVFTVLRQEESRRSTDPPTASAEPVHSVDRLAKLADLLEKGLITPEEFAKLKTDIL